MQLKLGTNFERCILNITRHIFSLLRKLHHCWRYCLTDFPPLILQVLGVSEPITDLRLHAMAYSDGPLLGVIAYVDVRSDKDNHSTAVSEVLRTLGATIASKLLPHVTHVVFKNGSRSTLASAKQYKCKVVNVQWVERCNETCDWVSEEPYKLHQDAQNSTSKKQRSMQPKDFELEFELASEKVMRPKRRKSDIQIPSPLSLMASDRIKINHIQAPRTPPAMQKKLSELRERRLASGSVTESGNIKPPQRAEQLAEDALCSSPALRKSHQVNVSTIQSSPKQPANPKVTPVMKGKKSLGTRRRPLSDTSATSISNGMQQCRVNEDSINSNSNNSNNSSAVSNDNVAVPVDNTLSVGFLSGENNSDSDATTMDENENSLDSSILTMEVQNLITPVSNGSSNGISKVIHQPPKAVPKRKGNIVLTSFHSADRGVIKAIIKKLGGFTISPQVDNATTHVVCGDDRRTINVLRGISLGCWIVSKAWVFSSLDNADWLDSEDSFVMCSAFRGASLHRRSNALAGKKIFGRLGSMFISKNTKPAMKDLAELIQINGGMVSRAVKKCCIIIGDTKEYSGTKVRESWILDCVAAQKLLAIEPYLLRS